MESIPLEIWALLLNFMDVNSKLKLRCTSAYLFEIIDHRDFVIYFARSKQLPEMVKVFSRYKRPIGLTFKKTKKLDTKSVKYLSKLSNLVYLVFDDHKGLKKKGSALSGLVRLTNLHSLSFGPNNFIDEYVLNQLTNLTHIRKQIIKPIDVVGGKSNLVSLDLGILEDFSLVSKLENLTSLKVDYYSHEWNKIWPGDQMKDLERMTNLKSLEISAGSYYEFPIQLHTLTRLHSLTLNRFDYVVLGDCTKLTKLELKKSYAGNNGTEKWTSLTNLKSLQLGNRISSKDQRQFLTALTNLCEFGQLKDDYFFLDFLRSDNLTSLSFSVKNDMQLVTRLTNLQKLSLKDDDNADYNFLTAFMKLTHLEITSVLTEKTRETLTCVQHLMALKVFKVIYSHDSYNRLDEDAVIQFNFADLRQLEELQVLIITYEAFESLRGLTRLTSLTANHDAQLIPEVLEKLPLKVLHLPASPFMECDWSAILRLTDLESLRIRLERGKELTQAETRLLSLTALQHLTALYIPRFDFNLNLEYISRLTNLQKLSHPGDSKKKLKKMPFLYDYNTDRY